MHTRHNRSEAAQKAAALREDPKVKAWMRRARRLFADLPAGAWIYWQEDQMHLMARAPEGAIYVFQGDRCDPGASVASVIVPGSDCGGW